MLNDSMKLEALNKRRQNVQIKHAKLSAQVDAARKEYQDLSDNAQKEFGTSKLPELEAMLVALRQSNAAVLIQAEQEISAAEEAVAKFKVDFAAVQAGASF